jgi:hypothetical protein
MPSTKLIHLFLSMRPRPGSKFAPAAELSIAHLWSAKNVRIVLGRRALFQ